MTPDEYITSIVTNHTPEISYEISSITTALTPHIHAWSNGHKYELKLSGSLAKGTGITGSTDIDLFISLDPSVGTCNTLENVYNTLRNRCNLANYQTREQNVSIGIEHGGLKIDLVAGVKHHPLGFDHSIWKRKAKRWTKTNIDEHINYVVDSGRTYDIRALKIWRKLRGLDFPSFYLELSAIDALSGKSLTGSPSEHFTALMNYLVDEFVDKTIVDPSNSTNEVSEELNRAEKELIRDMAQTTLQGSWEQAIW